MSSFGRKVSVVLMSISVFFAPCNFAFARSDINEYIDMYSQNDILFYDPGECDEEEDGSTCLPPTGNQVTWIGDSYSVGAVDIIERELPGVDYGKTIDDEDSYIQECKFVSTDTECHAKPTNPNGIGILKKIKEEGNLRPYVVFALGANGGITADQIKEVVEIVGGDTQVVFANLYMTDTDKKVQETIKSSNKALKKAAGEYSNVTVADWASAANEDYYKDDPEKTHPTAGDGYKTWVKTIKSALPTSCSAGILPGNTNEEIVWNFFVKADIKGVSDNPAVIAGIVGNLNVETGGTFDPFAHTNGTKYYGIHQTDNADFKKMIDDAGFDKYWGFGTSASPEEIKKALNLELEWIIKNNPRWMGGQTKAGSWAKEFSFLQNLKTVDSTTSPESYAELFLVTVEGANYSNTGTETELQDSKVKALAKKMLSGDNGLWQGADVRAEKASDAYDRLANSSKAPSGADSDFSSTETLSSSGNVKYKMGDDDIKTILRFSIYVADKNKAKYYDIISEILDDFEQSNANGKGNGDKLMEYIKDKKGKFKYKDEYKKFSKDDKAKKVKLKSKQIKKAESIIKKGLRTTSTTNAEITTGTTSTASNSSGSSDSSDSSDSDSSSSSGSSGDSRVCPDKKKKRGAGGARIAEAAALMSWPVQSSQKDAEDFKSDRVGKCSNDGRDANTYKKWVDWESEGESCYYTPRKLYRDNYVGQGPGEYANRFNPGNGFSDRVYMDCSWFVGSVMNYVFGKDYGFPVGGPKAQHDFAATHSEDWQQIPAGSTLKAGDLVVTPNDGHVMIYVGSYGGEYGEWAQASADSEVGLIKQRSDWSGFDAFRYIGSALGDGDIDENGLTYEQARQFMMNYGENKNNSSKKALDDAGAIGQWYINCPGNDESRGLGGSNCVTFSAFFMAKFTSMKYGGGNGNTVVTQAVGKLTRGTEPKVWSVFSWDSADGYGHTGVVLGHHDDTWIVGHASCDSSNAGKGDGTQAGGGSGFVATGDITTALLGVPASGYAYPDSVDLDAISTYLETGE